MVLWQIIFAIVAGLAGMVFLGWMLEQLAPSVFEDDHAADRWEGRSWSDED